MDIIVDIDGTLADIEHRLHYIRPAEGVDATTFKANWDAFFLACGDDTPIRAVCDLVRGLYQDKQRGNILFASGRPERVRVITIQWLWKWIGPPDHLYLRADGDHRPDHVVKKEMLERMRADGYDPRLAIDDRQQVVDMWRREGLICLQCAEGKY